MLRALIELTAAGTVLEFHEIPILIPVPKNLETETKKQNKSM